MKKTALLFTSLLASFVLTIAITGCGGSNNSDPGTVLDDMMYFGMTDGTHGLELVKTDGTATGTTLVKNIEDPGDSYPGYTYVFNNALYFVAYTAAEGEELWKTDGTEAGTTMVRDINLGVNDSNPSKFTGCNGTLFFVANDASYDNELWKTDGTDAGTMRVKNLNSSSSSYPDDLVCYNNQLFFIANDGAGKELWKTDGTDTGTIMVKDIGSVPGEGASYGLTIFNNLLYFAADDGTAGNELWKSDGTESGTVLAHDIWDSGSSNPDWFTVTPDGMFFNCWDGDTSSSSYYDIYKIDNSGTLLPVAERDSQDFSNPQRSRYTYLNGFIYFAGDSNGSYEFELWRTDGTTTEEVKDINSALSGQSNPGNFIAWNNMLLFAANNGTNGIELWKSDGTDAGTVMVRDINTGGDSNPTGFTVYNSELYFIATDGVNGYELWKTDGTAAGTVRVLDYNPAGDAFPVAASI